MDKVNNNQEYFELMRIKTFVENIPRRRVDLAATPYRLPRESFSDGEQAVSRVHWQTLRSTNELFSSTTGNRETCHE